MLPSRAQAVQDLPARLEQDLRELLARDNNSLVRWVDSRRDDEAHWFCAHLRTDGYRFEIALRFWVPDTLPERALQATLPAHLEIEEFHAGEFALVRLGWRRLSEWRAAIPKVARLVARLIVTFWEPDRSDDVERRALEYDTVLFEIPYPQLPTYGQ